MTVTTEPRRVAPHRCCCLCAATVYNNVSTLLYPETNHHPRQSSFTFSYLFYKPPPIESQECQLFTIILQLPSDYFLSLFLSQSLLLFFKSLPQFFLLFPLRPTNLNVDLGKQVNILDLRSIARGVYLSALPRKL